MKQICTLSICLMTLIITAAHATIPQSQISIDELSKHIAGHVNGSKFIFNKYKSDEKGPYETTEQYTNRVTGIKLKLESQLLKYYNSKPDDILEAKIPVQSVIYNADLEIATITIPGISMPYTAESAAEGAHGDIIPQILCFTGDILDFDGKLKLSPENNRIQIKRVLAKNLDIINNKGFLELTVKFGYSKTWYTNELNGQRVEQNFFPSITLLSCKWKINDELIWESKRSQKLWKSDKTGNPAKFGEQIILTHPSDELTEIYPEKVENTLGMTFVYIAPGSFMMGSPKNERDRDKTELQHHVTLSKGFYIQTTEVTQAQWYDVMKTNPSKHSACGGNCPVESISWNMVQKFITKLNTIEKNKRYRLPTEAEWEFSARANSPDAYCFGNNTDNLDQYGWYMENSGGMTHDVAIKNPNKFGIYDMHGNVWEWCQDWPGDYPPGSVIDPAGNKSGWEKVLRGGSYKNPAYKNRSAARFRNHTGSMMPNYGFRLVYSPTR